MNCVVSNPGSARIPRAVSEVQPAELRGLIRTVQLRNGATVTLRPLLREDERLEREFLEHLSPESRYLRLFVPVPRLTDELLDRLMNVDFDHGMALMATTQRADGAQEVGIARYCVLPGTRAAEFAIVVADDWRGTGLARALLEALISAARAVHRLQRLEGITLAENDRMRGLAQALGFTSEPDPADRQVLRLVLDL